METVYRGQVYFAELSGEGAVQKYCRPVIVVSNNIGNAHSPVVSVVPITSKEKKDMPTHFQLELSKVKGTVLCEQITTISKDTLGTLVGCLSRYYVDKLNECLRAALDLEGKYSNNADPIVDLVAYRQLESCLKAQQELEQQIYLLKKMIGYQESEVSTEKTKRTYIRRTEEVTERFISAWENCFTQDGREKLAKEFDFNSVTAARTFYLRHRR